MSTEYCYLLNANAEQLNIAWYSDKNQEFIAGYIFYQFKCGLYSNTETTLYQVFPRASILKL